MRFRTALITCLLAGSALSQDTHVRKDAGHEKIRQLIEHLGDDDVQVREEAARTLIQRGDLAIRQLEAAWRSKDPEIAARSQDVLAAIVGFRFMFKGAKEGVVFKSTPTPLVVQYTNTASKAVIYHRRGFELTLRLLELKDKAPDEFKRRGRASGRGSTGCNLSERHFVQLKSYASHEVKEPDVRDLHLEVAPDLLEKDPNLKWKIWTMRGDKILRGRYAIVVTYQYNTATYVLECSKPCRYHDDPRMQWNRCSETPLEATFEFEIK